MNTDLLAGLPPLDDTATDLESLQVLFQLVAYVRPKVILEAGTYQGHFAVGAAKLLPESRIYTFDPIDHGWDKTLVPNVEFLQRDFDSIPEPFDFAFVDSGPPFAGFWDYDVRWRHWQLACLHVNPSGLVVCHDTNATDWRHATEIIRQGVPLKGGRGLTLWCKHVY